MRRMMVVRRIGEVVRLRLVGGRGVRAGRGWSWGRAAAVVREMRVRARAWLVESRPARLLVLRCRRGQHGRRRGGEEERAASRQLLLVWVVAAAVRWW